jgi:hypothetical protein
MNRLFLILALVGIAAAAHAQSTVGSTTGSTIGSTAGSTVGTQTGTTVGGLLNSTSPAAPAAPAKPPPLTNPNSPRANTLPK